MKVPSSTQTRRVVLDAEDDDPLYQLGRSYFDSREYLRCFHLLQNATGSKSQFLASYALYLAGEMRKQESAASDGPASRKTASSSSGTSSASSSTSSGTSGAPSHSSDVPVNPFLADLSSRLLPLAPVCPYSAYLRGVVLRAMGSDDASVALFALAVRQCPMLWCAWWELARAVCGANNSNSSNSSGGNSSATNSNVANIHSPAASNLSGAFGAFQNSSSSSFSSPPQSVNMDISNVSFSPTSPTSHPLHLHNMASSPPTSPPPPFTIHPPASSPSPSVVSSSSSHLSVDVRLAGLGVPTSHWMHRFFQCHLRCEMQNYEQCMDVCEAVLATCPQNVFARTQKALTMYNMREFDAAEKLFESLWREDPYRISEMDVYSNVLYVRGEKPKLAYLAQRVSKTDRYRPESCCIIGNYYSMRGDHTRAVMYFQRALRLNPHYLSAWTLMGHEYMELSNAVAAVNCYRRAVDINDRDFRAWYALGQAYEILGMYSFALWYFHRACGLRSTDSRMWVALGGCLERVERPMDAIRAYERAVACGDGEGVALRQLAKLHEQQHDADRAAYCYKCVLDALDAKKAETPVMVEALLYLAKHGVQKGFLKEAEKYCFRLLDFAVPEKEEAKALLKIIHLKAESIVP